MNKKELIETCEKIMKDLQKRVNNRHMYGEDWDVSYDTICNDEYVLSISIEDCDAFSIYSGKMPHSRFRLMNNETCTFLIDETDFETFMNKVLEVVN